MKNNLLVELFVEELPPKALKKLGEAFATTLTDSLKAQGLVDAAVVPTPFASPRRLAVHIQGVSAEAPTKETVVKLMPRKVAYNEHGEKTSAFQKRLTKEGYIHDDHVMQLVEVIEKGETYVGLKKRDLPIPKEICIQQALGLAIARLPIPKVMSYQLADGWSSVHFVRPAHGLVALWGSDVVPVQALGLRAGRTTRGHRFEARSETITLTDADSYAETLRREGAVIASFAERRAEIARQLQQAAAQLGGGVRPIEDDALLDEVTALVERPKVLVCQFEPEFLAVPQECLILTMKANQKYFPLLDAQGRLTNRFLVVSNIDPADPSAVIGGNERVVRPRLADAKFFYDQDRKKTLASRVPGLAKVVYHNKLGSQGERVERVRAIARAIAQQLGGGPLLHQADTAAQLAKADLLTDMVGEFPELQGIMGAYYARHDGLDEEIAQAIEDHYKPRFAGDALPRGTVGLVVALADKLETLVGMFGIGNLPTGEKDPYALRRHALGVIRMLGEKALPLELDALLRAAVPAFGERIQDPTDALLDFVFERLAGSLREQGYSAQEVDAVLALRPQRLAEVPRRLAAVRAFSDLPEAGALAAANKRIANILKKAGDVDPHVSPVLLQEPAEQQLHAAMQQVLPQADAQFAQGDYTASLRTLAGLRAPVDAFFDGVMVNAEQDDLRLNRLGLLKRLHTAMNRVADLSRLAV